MPCYCTRCYPSTPFTHATAQKHFKLDLATLSTHPPSDPSQRSFIEQCIQRNQAYLRTGRVQEVDDDSGKIAPSQVEDQPTPIASTTAIEALSDTVGPEANLPERSSLDLDYGDAGSFEPDPMVLEDGFPMVLSEDDDAASDMSEDFLSENWWQENTVEEEISQDDESLPTGLPTPVELSDSTEDGGPDIDDDSMLEDQDFLSPPPAVLRLRESLLKGYKPSPNPPAHPPHLRPLSLSERNSLRHYVAWIKSNGTVDAYEEHAYSLEQSSGVPVLSLHLVPKLAGSLVDFVPREVHMCVKSCIAYTGHYAQLRACPYVAGTGKVPCGEPRYRSTSSGRQKPRAVVKIHSPMATIRAMFANTTGSCLLRKRESLLQQALHLVGTAKQRYSDYANSQTHILQHTKLGLFQEKRDVAFAISTDGAQLTMKKQSNTWLILLIILNLPAEIRYQTSNVIVNFATPGPRSPGDIESFLWVLFEEMLKASEGIWMWDALDSSYFLHRAAVVMALGDMLGSAKLSGMAGHMALKGDRFTSVLAAKAPSGKALYYPLSAPQNSIYNPVRPARYDTKNLPMRTQEDYWKTVTRLEHAATKKEQEAITRATGVSKLPLCAASPAFIHPSFFPADPFHLFYENCMAFLWDTMTASATQGERIHFSKSAEMGALIPLAMETLPPSFCGPIRDVHQKRNSQYKVYEWMAILHWYFIPIAVELHFDSTVLTTFSRFVEAIDFAMTVKPQSTQDLQSLHDLISHFLADYERLFVANDPHKVHRSRLCLFQLIHVPIHIQWNGSIRLGSQATVERAIGEAAHKIRSRKAPFSNLANIIYQRELFKILVLYYPELLRPDRPPKKTSGSLKTMQEHYLAWSKVAPESDLINELKALSTQIGVDVTQRSTATIVRRWGKFRLPGGHILQSRLSQQRSKPARRSEWFEATPGLDNIETSANLIFGHALAFYSVTSGATDQHPRIFVAYTPLTKITKIFNYPRGIWASDGAIKVMEVANIRCLVGIWEGINTKETYILRKHAGLEYLSTDERGLDSEDGQEGQDEEA